MFKNNVSSITRQTNSLNFNNSFIQSVNMYENMFKQSENININNLNCESLYTENILNGCSAITNHKFDEALNNFQKALTNANNLQDQYKIYESKCYIGITHYYKENINESLNILEEIYNPIFEKCANEKFSNDIKNLEILIKIAANLSMIYFAINKINDASTIITNIIAIIEKEVSPFKQLSILKHLIYILFQVNSLKGKSNIHKNSNFTNDSYNNIINLLFKGFNDYLREGKIENWIKILQSVYSQMEKINDYKGLIFILFNKEASILIKERTTSNISLNESNIKLNSLLLALNKNNNSMINSSNQTIIEKILNNFKEKMLIAHQIYLNIYNAENRIYESISQKEIKNNINENKNTYFIKLMINYALKEIQINEIDDNLKNKLTDQLKETLDIIDNKSYDLSYIKLETLDSQISQNLNIMFENLKYIYKKNKLLKYFKQLKGNLSIVKSIKKDNIWEDFYQKQLNYIKYGSNIIKINLTSNGKREHYYKINSDKDLIEIYEKKYKNDSSPNKVIEFDKIYKIYFGIISNNLIKKKNLLSYNNKPWNYLSIIEKNKSLDWEFNKFVICKNWFYGLHNYLLKSNRQYKIISITGFIIRNLKMKIHPYDLKQKETFVKLMLKSLKINEI